MVLDLLLNLQQNLLSKLSFLYFCFCFTILNKIPKKKSFSLTSQFFSYFRRRLEANEEKSANSRGHCSDSSRSSSIMGNHSSPDSQSPSPPTTSSNGGSDSTNGISNGECSNEYTSKKYSSPKHERRSYWKKRYHDHKDADDEEETGNGSNARGEPEKKIPRNSKSPERKRMPSGSRDGSSANGNEAIKNGLKIIQGSGSDTGVMENDQEQM